MLKHAICIPILVAAAALSACTQGSMSTNPLGSTGATQPSHRVKSDLTSTSVTIQNAYSSPIGLVSESALCLSGSPPSSVPANSSSSAFSVSYTGSCAADIGHFYMTYDPDGALADACTFKIDYTVSSGVFTYSVANNANTNCVDIPGVTPGTVTFKYVHD